MKNIKLNWLGFIVPVFWLILLTAVNAQTKLLVEPEDLTIAGTRFSSVENRPIFIANDKEISNLQVTPRSLYRTDGLAVFPKSAIKIQASEEQTNSTVFPVDFDLQKTPSSGEFSGKLDLSYQPAGEDSAVTVGIPVTIKVKDSYYLPLFVLLVGIVIGFAVSYYRDRLLKSQQSARLLELYHQIMQQGKAVAVDSAEKRELLLSWLVVKQQGTLRVQNRIYSSIFI